jgi:O-antigen ligase
LLLFTLTFFLIDFTLVSRSHGSSMVVNVQHLVKGALYAAMLVYALRHGITAQINRPILMVFLLYAVYALISASWSPVGVVGFGSAIGIVACALMAGVISSWSRGNIEKLFYWFFYAVLITGAVSLLMYIVVPEHAVAYMIAGENRLQGIRGSPNSLGPSMALGIIIGFLVFARSQESRMKLLSIAGIALMLIVLLMTDSRTAIAGLGISLGLFFLIKRPRLLMVAVALLFLLPVVYQLMHTQILDFVQWLLASASRSGSMYEILSFTGRTEIWAFCVSLWLDAPWWGYGIGSPRILISENYANQWGGTTHSAHNVLLESLLNVGVFGTLLLFIPFFYTGVKLLKGIYIVRESREVSHILSVSFCLWMFLLFSGLLEKTFAGTLSPGLIILALLLGIVCNKEFNAPVKAQNLNRKV